MGCTAGLLQGALFSGVLLALSMINTGGAWEHAKKYIEANSGKDSDQHTNAVIGDIVGDPLKDVSGPSINVLMNLGAITGLVFSYRINHWSNEVGGPSWFHHWIG